MEDKFVGDMEGKEIEKLMTPIMKRIRKNCPFLELNISLKGILISKLSQGNLLSFRIHCLVFINPEMYHHN